VNEETYMLDVLILVIVLLEVASIVLSLNVWNHRHDNFPAVEEAAAAFLSIDRLARGNALRGMRASPSGKL
jgi:hypothetical protein